MSERTAGVLDIVLGVLLVAAVATTCFLVAQRESRRSSYELVRTVDRLELAGLVARRTGRVVGHAATGRRPRCWRWPGTGGRSPPAWRSGWPLRRACWPVASWSAPESADGAVGWRARRRRWASSA
ncbi:MAG: hypothetical protein R2711_05835 [Acidimicrobiales bacterium]